MQFIASGNNKEKFITSTIYGPHVSITKSGIPRVFPTRFRQSLRQNNKGDIKILLTILNLYKVLPFEGRVKLETITKPWGGSLVDGMEEFVPIFWKFFNPRNRSLQEYFFEPFPIFSGGSLKKNFYLPFKKKVKV